MYNALPYLSALAAGAVIALIFAEIITRLFSHKQCGYTYMCIFMLGQVLLPPFASDLLFPYRGVMPGWAIFFTLFFGAIISAVMITVYIISVLKIKGERVRFVLSLLIGYSASFFLITNFVK